MAVVACNFCGAVLGSPVGLEKSLDAVRSAGSAKRLRGSQE